jgi:hypothetical protein
LEDALEEVLGGATAHGSGFLSVFEEYAELQACAKVTERLEILRCLPRVQELSLDMVRGFYGPREQVDAINRLDEETAYFPALVMYVSTSTALPPLLGAAAA